MRKKVFGRKLSRETGSRRALFRSLVRELVLHGKIMTTKPKAKAVVGQVDKLITIARGEDKLQARRRVMAWTGNDKEVTKLIFEKILPMVGERKSGLTRIVNFPVRRGDNAQVVRFEFVDKPKPEKPVTSDKLQVKSKKVKKDE